VGIEVNRNDVTAILRKRLEFLELIGNPYPYQDEEIKLLAGDNILMKIVPGWTTRECIATCHLHLVDNKDIYMVDYWLAEWSGTPNLAKERGMKLAEKRNQEEEAVSKDYDEI